MANCPWTRSSSHDASVGAAAPVTSVGMEQKHKSSEKNWSVKQQPKSELATSPRGYGSSSSSISGHVKPEVKPMTNVKREPVSPGAAGIGTNQTVNYGSGKIENQGKVFLLGLKN